MIKRLMITTFSILKCLFPDICIYNYKTIICTLQKVRKITPNINNIALFEAIIIHQYNENKTALFFGNSCWCPWTLHHWQLYLCQMF